MSDTNEEIVGRVLQGLRDAASPEGMESRIVSAVRHRAATMPVPSRLGWRIASLAGGIALAGVVCALFFTARHKTLQAVFPRSQATAMQAGNVPITPPLAATWKPPKSPVRRAKLTVAVSAKREELASISYPAPPMPLTKQEKLLLHIVHQGDPVQIAMLDPVQRDMRYAEERAEVQRFFIPSTSGEYK